MEKQPNVLVENKNGLGIITLNRIKALNALSLDMVNTIQKQLNEWKNDPTVFLVYIHSASEKAFCTGGDIKALYEHAIKEDYEYTAKYLSKQYLMDYTIHTYEKPILVYINGYIMGGGVGLAIGGSYRIVTEQTKLAMPEIQICFIPDVGASYFLNQLPGAVGTYLGLTGRTIDGNDSLFLGIADYYIHSEKWKELEKIIKNKKWKNKTCKDELTQLLEQYETIDLPESTIEEKIDVIETNFSFDEIEDIIEALSYKDSWAEKVLKEIRDFSPTFLKLILELLNRGKNKTLFECFKMELDVSMNIIKTHDFEEGIRGTFVDKNKKFQWSPKHLNQVSQMDIDLFFQYQWKDDKHPMEK